MSGKVTQIRPFAQMPSCPTWLSTAAKKEWRRVFPKLARMARLTRSVFDGDFLAIYCQEFSDWKRIRDELDREKKTRGKTLEYESHRLLEKLARQCYRDTKMFSRKFGFPMTEKGMDLSRPLPLGRGKRRAK